MGGRPFSGRTSEEGVRGDNEVPRGEVRGPGGLFLRGSPGGLVDLV